MTVHLYGTCADRSYSDIGRRILIVMKTRHRPTARSKGRRAGAVANLPAFVSIPERPWVLWRGCAVVTNKRKKCRRPLTQLRDQDKRKFTERVVITTAGTIQGAVLCVKLKFGRLDNHNAASPDW